MRQFFKLGQLLGFTVTSIVLSAGLASCGSDDEPKADSGKGYITIDGKTNNFISGLYELDNDGSTIFLASCNVYNATPSTLPSSIAGQLYIDFEGNLADGETRTIASEDYLIEFYRNSRYTDDSDYEFKSESSWIWIGGESSNLDGSNKEKSSGPMIISRQGYNFNIKISDLWLFGGSEEANSPQAWSNGSLEWSGELRYFDDYFGDYED